MVTTDRQLSLFASMFRALSFLWSENVAVKFNAMALAVLYCATQPMVSAQNTKPIATMKIGVVGWPQLPPLKPILDREVSSQDKGRILRAFSSIPYHRARAEAIPVLEGFLSSNKPYVRLMAADQLFTMGDTRGYWVLLALVKSEVPYFAFDKDIRISAAEILSRYREAEATAAIVKLYRTTGDGELIDAIDTLSPTDGATLIPDMRYIEDPHTLIGYGRIRFTAFDAKIEATFHSSKEAALKTAAAWALATMHGNTEAIDYLVTRAEAGLRDPGMPGSISQLDEAEVLKCLGTIQTPAAKRILEEALDYPSRDPTVAEIALINLIYNQGGSDKALQKIVHSIEHRSDFQFPVDFLFRLAGQLTNFPTIAEAGRIYAETDSSGIWNTYAVERRDWPIYGWIDAFIVDLKEQPQVASHGPVIGFIDPIPPEPVDIVMPEHITEQDLARFYGSTKPILSEPIVIDPEVRMFIRHPDGVPWTNAPVYFHVTGSRLISKTNGAGPFQDTTIVLSDSHGIARVYLQPLPGEEK